MSFYSSQSRSSTSTNTRVGNRQISVESDFDRYCKENVKQFEASGGKIIDYYYYTPPDNVTTLFRCTQFIQGRLYPNPGAADIFVLDFVDNNGTRVFGATGLTMYDVGTYGFEERRAIRRAGSSPEHPGIYDLYMLSTGRIVEVVDAENRLVKKIAFIYRDRSTVVPDFR